MTKRYAILQKKLQDLESSLAQVFSLPAEETPCHHLLADDIHQRLLFLNNLLSAEIASHPSKPHHLVHIAHRLTELESAFRDWDHHRTDSHNLDAVSTCSCTESCLNDDGEGEEGELELAVYEEEPEIFYEAVADDDGLVEVRQRDDEERDCRVWRCFPVAMGGGVVVGAVVVGFVMVRFSGCFRPMEHHGFLVPT